MTRGRDSKSVISYEIINHEDIGNAANDHVNYITSNQKRRKSPSNDGTFEVVDQHKNDRRIGVSLTSSDVQNLQYYLKKHSYLTKSNSTSKNNNNNNYDKYSFLNNILSDNHYTSPKSTPKNSFYDITNDFYSGKIYADLDDVRYKSLPSVDAYRHHHHHHRRHYYHQHDHVPHTPDDDKQAATERDDINYNKYLLNGGLSVQKIEDKASMPSFILDVVTCGMQKDMRLPIPKENYSLNSGKFGDDAGFTAQRLMEHYLGVADGAGGNKMYGFNPKLFSNSLMKNCLSLFHTGNFSVQEPKKLLCNAFDYVQNENCYGSSTACLVGVDCSTARLYSVNIGDSGYVILRDGTVLYRSRSQKMNGDCPRQLDVYPWTAALKQKGLNYTQISSLDAICQSFQLIQDDIIILSTDGLFDNVHDHMIEMIVANCRSLSHAAEQLVNRAVRFYSKPDDILVIIARLKNAPV